MNSFDWFGQNSVCNDTLRNVDSVYIVFVPVCK